VSRVVTNREGRFNKKGSSSKSIQEQSGRIEERDDRVTVLDLFVVYSLNNLSIIHFFAVVPGPFLVFTVILSTLNTKDE